MPPKTEKKDIRHEEPHLSGEEVPPPDERGPKYMYPPGLSDDHPLHEDDEEGLATISRWRG